MTRQIPFAIPELGPEEIQEVVNCLTSGWITTGPKTSQFESDFAEYIGMPFSLTVNSATAGLHLALDAVGVTRGDKVIVPTYTFTATAEVVRYFDADPIFCDIDPQSYCIDVKMLEELILKHKPKAIMPVHFAGQACDMTSIMKLAQKYDVRVIEDAAHALPTTHNGKLIGTIGDITVFSFYATKTITTGEGGMVVTRNEEYAKRMKVMRLHGFNRDAWNRYTDNKAAWYYEIVAPGYKYNMTDIASSLGIHQLKKCNLFYEKRKRIADIYNKEFASIPGLSLPQVLNPSDKHAWHLYVIKVAKNRNEFILKLKDKGVGASMHFIPLHTQPYWKEKYNLKETDFPVAYDNYLHSLSLPIFTKMSDEDITQVVQAVKETAKELLA